MRFTINNTKLSNNSASEEELLKIVEDCRSLVRESLSQLPPSSQEVA